MPGRIPAPSPRPGGRLEPDRRPHQPRARPPGYPAPAAGRGLQAQARYAAGGWTVNQATATVGSAPAQAAWTCRQLCARHGAAVQGSIRLRNLSPAALHPAGGVAPVGSVQAQMPSQASPPTSPVVRLTADIRSAAPTGTAPASATDLRIDAFTAQGQWNPEQQGTVHIERLALDALRARLQATDLRISRGAPPGATPAAAMPPQLPPSQARGLVQLTLPGSQVRVTGQYRPAHWPGRRPLEPDRCRTNPALAGPLALAGQRPARHAAHRLGQRPGTASELQMEGRLEHAAAATAHGSPGPAPSADAKAPPFQLQPH